MESLYIYIRANDKKIEFEEVHRIVNQSTLE